MKTRRRKHLLIGLVLVAALLMSVAVPREVEAMNASQLTDHINSFDHGGIGKLHAQQSHNQVLVTGSVVGASKTLTLVIDQGIKVLWKAQYWGTAKTVLKLATEASRGTFEVASGGSIKGNNDFTIYNEGDSRCAVIVNGGEIINENQSSGTALVTGSLLTVSAGRVIATGHNGKAIWCGLPTAMTMTGGVVTTKGSGVNAAAILLGITCEQSYLHLKGGTIGSPRDAIVVDGSYCSIQVDGATVQSAGAEIGSAIYLSNAGSHNKVEVSSGTVSAWGTGLCHAICSDSPNTVVDIKVMGHLSSRGNKGGTVWLRATPSKMTVSGSTRVENLGAGDAIRSASEVQINYGQVSAGTGVAVNAAKAMIDGGFLFAYGTGAGDIVHRSQSYSYKEGAVMCAWNKPAGSPSYEMDSSQDLSTVADGRVKWGREGDQSGIAYKYGEKSSTRFFPLAGVTVKIAVPSKTEP
jgi:hypothetical protein